MQACMPDNSTGLILLFLDKLGHGAVWIGSRAVQSLHGNLSHSVTRKLTPLGACMGW